MLKKTWRKYFGYWPTPSKRYCQDWYISSRGFWFDMLLPRSVFISQVLCKGCSRNLVTSKLAYFTYLGEFSNPLKSWLMVEPTHLKNMLVKMGSSSPIFRGEHSKNRFEKPPPRKGSDWFTYFRSYQSFRSVLHLTSRSWAFQHCRSGRCVLPRGVPSRNSSPP